MEMNSRTKPLSTFAVVSLCALGTSLGCGLINNSSTAHPPPANGSLQTHDVDAASTGAGISSSFGSHQALVDTGVASNGRLLLFLPGTAAEPRAYQRLLTVAAEEGYHAIGLAYPNDESLQTICGNDTSCYEPVRLEIFDGTDRTNQISVDSANSVVNRTVTLLQHLDGAFGDEGWGAFLQNGNPSYGDITISGHSQGGGEAAIIAKVETVARVAMFSAPVDAVDGSPAAWVNQTHQTPTNRYFAFAHQDDPFFDDITANWEALGMGAASSAVLVDTSSAPYGGSHELETALPAAQPHNATAVDEDTPLAGDAPVYGDAWRTVLGP